MPPSTAPDATQIVSELIAAIDAARDAVNRSVLDGTISCRRCRALILQENAAGHAHWHEHERGAS